MNTNSEALHQIGRLEYWNNGILSFGIMVWWFNGQIHLEIKING
jgi:hypothetical protein